MVFQRLQVSLTGNLGRSSNQIVTKHLTQSLTRRILARETVTSVQNNQLWFHVANDDAVIRCAPLAVDSVAVVLHLKNCIFEIWLSIDPVACGNCLIGRDGGLRLEAQVRDNLRFEVFAHADNGLNERRDQRTIFFDVRPNNFRIIEVEGKRVLTDVEKLLHRAANKLHRNTFVCVRNLEHDTTSFHCTRQQEIAVRCQTVGKDTIKEMVVDRMICGVERIVG
ncbi:hypothetical protein D3C75_778940 [compost metagenome]